MTTPKLTPRTTPTVTGQITLSSPERCKLLLDRLARHHRETHAPEEATSEASPPNTLWDPTDPTGPKGPKGTSRA